MRVLCSFQRRRNVERGGSPSMTTRGGLWCRPARRAARASRLVALAGLLVLAVGAAAAAHGDVTAGGSPRSLDVQRVTVVMGVRRCSASLGAPLVAGRVDFAVRNRSGRPRRFAIAGRRTRFVPRSRAGRPPRDAPGRTPRLRVPGEWAPRQHSARQPPRVGARAGAAPVLERLVGDVPGVRRGPGRATATGQVTFGVRAPACVPGNPVRLRGSGRLARRPAGRLHRPPLCRCT